MGKVAVYDGDDIVARVEYTNNLDYWDGRNHSCGSVGRHKGLTRLRNGQYVLIRGTQWQGERDHAEIISPSEALQEILSSGNDELFNEKRFADLKKLMDKELISEVE